ncbi:MAG: sugar transferase [Pseudomonadota bacterium]
MSAFFRRLPTVLFAFDLAMIFLLWSLPAIIPYLTGLDWGPQYLLDILLPCLIHITLFIITYPPTSNYNLKFFDKKKLLILSAFSFLLTYITSKFILLLYTHSNYIPLKYYLGMAYPAQVLIFFIYRYIVTNHPWMVNKKYNILVIGNVYEATKVQSFIGQNNKLSKELVVVESVNLIKNKLTTFFPEIREYTFNYKSNYLKNIDSKFDIVVFFHSQKFDTFQTRDLLQFSSWGGSVMDFAEFCAMMAENYPIDEINTQHILQNCSNLWFKLNLLMRFKRTTEFFLSLGLLFLTIPLWIFAAMAIKLDSDGPIFFTQERIGRLGKRFKIIKFRTMKLNAEQAGPQFAIKNDLRVTKIGKFLRKTRIDELPQLINVLKGEMALVGPRPERDHFENILKKDLPLLQLRNFLPPGITGLAQVSCDYANDLQSYRQKLGHDIYYVLHFSPLLDLSILLRTVKTVLARSGH